MNSLYFRFHRALRRYFEYEPSRYAKGLASGFFRQQFAEIIAAGGQCTANVSDGCAVSYMVALDPKFTA